jgi:hypothetical protein
MSYTSNKHLRFISNKHPLEEEEEEVMDSIGILKWFFESTLFGASKVTITNV